MSALVTGACGFVGCNLVEHLLTLGRRVVAVDRTEAWPPDARERFAELPGELVFAAADVRDEAALERAFALAARSPGGLDGVLHAAAVTPGPEREALHADQVMDVNLMGTVRVLAAARAFGARRFVYPSSASVYGDAAFPDRALEEDRDTPRPNTIYAIAKYAAERSVVRLGALWRVDAVVARVGAVFGPWERDTGHRDTFSGPMLATRALRRGEHVVLAREGPRDWVYAPDVAGALIALLDARAPGFDLLHISAGRSWSLADWCRALATRIGSTAFTLDPESERPTLALPPRDRAPLSVERLRTVYEPRFGFDQALTHYLAWLDERSEAWHAAW